MTEDSRKMLEDTEYRFLEARIKVRQTVPADQQRGLGQVEGKGRWLQEVVQANMNRALELVRDCTITLSVARLFRYHAIRQSNLAGNTLLCKNDSCKSR